MKKERTKLQIPISIELKNIGEQRAQLLGFDSLNQAVRLFISQLAHGAVSFSFFNKTPDEILTPQEEERLIRLEDQARKEGVTKIQSGEDLIRKIYSHND